MKKVLVITAVMILTLMLLSCSDTQNINTETSAMPTTDVLKTPAQQTPVISEGSPCAMDFAFRSIADMHTYITTGSTDLAAYSDKPYVSFNYMEGILPSDAVRKMGYRPLSDFFDYDESKFEYTEALYFMTDEKWLVLAYTLDNCTVVVYLPSNKVHGVTTALEYRNKYHQSPYISYDAVDYEKISSVNKGYVMRNVDGNQILYRIDEGMKKEASIYVDGYFINVSHWLVEEGQTLNEVYDKFMTEGKYASFAALFSDDEQAAKSVISKLTNTEK